MDLAYDGADLSGFALQPDRETVTGLVRDALATVCRLDDAPYIVGAGRTDAGVHALAQVIHVDLPTGALREDDPVLTARLLRSANKLMAHRVRLARAAVVPVDFDARHSAQWRRYRYLVVPGSTPGLGTVSHYAWEVAGPLDLEAMNVAAAHLVGEHDFRAFCRRAPDKGPGEAIVRRVLEARWRAERDVLELTVGRAPIYVFDVRASSFCHQMVRACVATMVAVGEGRLGPEVVAERLADPSRDHLPAPAPPAGLALAGVGYADEFGGPSDSVEEALSALRWIVP